MDDPKAPHCRLVAMGHWVKDGLQMALILNMQLALGPRKDSYGYQAITQQINGLFTLRYQIGKSSQTPTFTAEGYAQSVPASHKPAMLVRLIDSLVKYRALTAATMRQIG